MAQVWSRQAENTSLERFILFQSEPWFCLDTRCQIFCVWIAAQVAQVKGQGVIPRSTLSLPSHIINIISTRTTLSSSTPLPLRLPSLVLPSFWSQSKSLHNPQWIQKSNSPLWVLKKGFNIEVHPPPPCCHAF